MAKYGNSVSYVPSSRLPRYASPAATNERIARLDARQRFGERTQGTGAVLLGSAFGSPDRVEAPAEGARARVWMMAQPVGTRVRSELVLR